MAVSPYSFPSLFFPQFSINSIKIQYVKYAHNTYQKKKILILFWIVQKTTRSIILQDECPVCITTQSMLVQLATGILYPLMGAVGGSYMVCNKYVILKHGYRITKLYKHKTFRNKY